MSDKQPMQASRAKTVSENDHAAYERDGVVCLRNVFPKAWLAFLAEAVGEAMQSPGRTGWLWPFLWQCRAVIAT